jgi:glycosyltransferase involved in cell wall biosynthesis
MIYFLVPVYNEEANMVNLFKELTALSIDDEIYYVFSDDGSTDSSKETIQRVFNGRQFIVLGDGINRGPGAAFNAGFRWILDHSKNTQDVVVTLEADCTSDLSILKTMLTLNQLGYDLVLASVYAQGGGFDKTTFLRKLISALANFMYRFLFDIKVLTISSFYRVYKVSLLRTISQRFSSTLIAEPGFVSMLEILSKSILCRASIIEVPMLLQSHKRIGQSKMKVVRTTFHYLRYLVRTKFNSQT